MRDPIFDPYLDRWGLTPDGTPIVTPAAHLLPVRRRGEAAMLKVVTLDEAKTGGVLLAWWDGHGAARVYEMDADAVLMERAEGRQSLAEFVRNDRDDEATHVLCDAVDVLHEPRGKPFPDLVPLKVWFEPLAPVALTHGGLLAHAAEAAAGLLANPRDIVPLHGDARSDALSAPAGDRRGAVRRRTPTPAAMDPRLVRSLCGVVHRRWRESGD